MEREELDRLKLLFGQNLIGPDELQPLIERLGWGMEVTVPDMNYTKEQLEDCSDDYLRWYLLRKQVIEESRAVMPDQLMEADYAFPTAILCAFAFFACWLCYGEKLWWHDFVWCCDTDHNGDRIYVGKYHDVDGVNKNGFSVHRHLALRQCYAAVNTI